MIMVYLYIIATGMLNVKDEKKGDEEGDDGDESGSGDNSEQSVGEGNDGDEGSSGKEVVVGENMVVEENEPLPSDEIVDDGVDKGGKGKYRKRKRDVQPRNTKKKYKKVPEDIKSPTEVLDNKRVWNMPNYYSDYLTM